MSAFSASLPSPYLRGTMGREIRKKGQMWLLPLAAPSYKSPICHTCGRAGRKVSHIRRFPLAAPSYESPVAVHAVEALEGVDGVPDDQLRR